MSPRIGLDLDKVVEAAVEIVDNEGFGALTLAILAKKLNIRTPSLYNHIDGLPALKQKIAVFGLEKLFSVMEEASKGRTGDAAIMSVGIAYVNFVRSHPGLYEAGFKPADLDSEEQMAAGAKIVELSLKLLRSYGLNERDAFHAVRGLRSLLHGFASIEQGGGFAMDFDRDESLRFTLERYLAGLKSM
ncbi:TetR/AcrR family transcriptional regulator [Fictibacillus aquaticus]|uniref:TetR family transcriptional regulator n=1 Tax=Fictibacillus aquaticus TaxID=2021314 RepID=A0A235F7U0_9BACL|nr:TetR/AcrR family transcriptional regulator [Fictibacillus aquaticus]OYD57269.1 TetR family transcriptional regulator [Fictibacillus aquaticus]